MYVPEPLNETVAVALVIGALLGVSLYVGLRCECDY